MFIYTALAARDVHPIWLMLAGMLGLFAALIITGSIFRAAKWKRGDPL